MKLGHLCETQMHKFGFANVHHWLDKLSPKSYTEIKFIWKKIATQQLSLLVNFAGSAVGFVCLLAGLFLYCLSRYQIVSILKESPGLKLWTHRQPGRTWPSPADLSSTLSEGSCQCPLYLSHRTLKAERWGKFWHDFLRTMILLDNFSVWLNIGYSLRWSFLEVFFLKKMLKNKLLKTNPPFTQIAYFNLGFVSLYQKVQSNYSER